MHVIIEWSMHNNAHTHTHTKINTLYVQPQVLYVYTPVLTEQSVVYKLYDDSATTTTESMMQR